MNTTVQKLLAAKRFFAANPTGKITTGVWTDPTWTKTEFSAWFIKCLLEKCGGSKYTERQRQKIHDGRIINDYIGKRHRRSGSRGVLRDPRMQRTYPQINNQVFEY